MTTHGISLIILVIVAFFFIFRKPVLGVYLSVLTLPILKFSLLPQIAGHTISLPDLFIILTLFIWLIHLFKKRQKIVIINPVIIFVLLLFVITGLLSLFNARNIYLGSIEILAYIYLMAYLFLIWQLITNKERVLILIKYLLIGYLIALCFGLYQIAIHQWQIKSTFLTLSQFAYYLISFIPLFLISVITAKNWKKFFIWLLIVVFSVTMLFKTGSTIGLIALTFILLSIFIWKLKYTRLWQVYSILLILFLVFTSFIIKLQPKVNLRYFIRGQLPVWEQTNCPPCWYTTGERTYFWNLEKTDPIRYLMFKTGLKLINRVPLIGVGWGNFNLYFAETEWQTFTEMHNIYLTFLTEGGILSFLIFLIFLILILRECWRALTLPMQKWKNINGALAIGFIANLILGLTAHNFRAKHLWFLIAIIPLINYLVSKNDNIRTDDVTEIN